jgi:gliding motility-associated protein GldL
MQGVTSKLTQLNSVYELELKESNAHSKAIGDYHKSMSSLINNITATQQSAEQMKTEVSKLAKNMASLNNVYGTMLSAMAQSKPA